MRIDGHAALVTGAGSGLGEATARMLAKKGALHVGVVDVNRQAAERVAKEVNGVALIADVASENDVTAAIEALTARNESLRIAVNCAGIAPAAKIVGRNGPMPLADFERVIRVNLIGTFNVMRLAAAHMQNLTETEDQARGVIVNTASIAAFEGQMGQTAYAASKGGVASLALPAARELARYGIRVNTIAPGIFLTPLLQSFSEEIQQGLAAGIPYPSRLGDPSEFADAVCFAIENQYLNAEMLRLDGAIRLRPR